MRRTVVVGALIPVLVVLAAASGLSRQTEKAPPSGPYLGHKLPGMTPEVFAPAVVSRDGIQMKLTMTADGSEILYTERDPATNAASFIIRRRAGDSWGEPLVLPYSREYMDIEPSLSPDGKKILFVSNRPASGQGEPAKMPDIWLAEKTGDQWGRPVRLGPPVLTDDPADIEAHPAFVPGRRNLFHAAERQNPPSLPGGAPRRRIRRTRALASQGRSARRPVQRAVPFPRRPDPVDALAQGRRLRELGPLRLVQGRDRAAGASFKNLGPAVNTDKPESSPTFSSDGQIHLLHPGRRTSTGSRPRSSKSRDRRKLVHGQGRPWHDNCDIFYE